MPCCLGWGQRRYADAGSSTCHGECAMQAWRQPRLHDGISWTRLQEVATLPIGQGGLALMGRSSAAFKAAFSRAPPNIVDDRPETDMLFLRSE